MYPKIAKWGVLACMFGLFLSISVPVRAQVAGATLSGVVTDPQGGVVPNAKISIRNAATGVTIDTATNASGAYTAPNLNPGDYTVSVSAPGFKTAASNVTLTVGAKQVMNLSLSVGEVSQTVEVTGAAVQVDLSSSTVSGNIQAAAVRELPLSGRDWASLATLEPGVASVRSQYSATDNPSAAGGRGLAMQLSIGGARPTQNSYRLDGAIVNDYSNSGPASVLGGNLGVDAIQEFSVLTTNYSAEYGFTSGGVVNAVTRSGTNTFHGSVYEFLRNDKLDAANFFSNAFGLPKNPLRQNQFGVAGGWRILKDKLFIFGNYEGVRQAQSLPHTDTTISPDVLTTGTIVNLTTGATATVPIDTTIQKFFGLYPKPSPDYSTPGGLGCQPLSSTQFSAPGVTGGCNPDVARFLWQGPQDASENFYTFRSDYRISDKDSLFGTYLHDYSTLNIPLKGEVNNSHFTTWRQAVVLEETHVFTPSVLNVVRLAYSRTQNDAGSTTAINPVAADPSLAMIPDQGFFSPNIVLTGAGVTTAAAGQGYAAPHRKSYNNLYELFDDAFVTKGTHSMKFGFTFMPDQTNAYHDSNGNGSGTFTYQGTYNVQGGSTQVPTAAEAFCYKGTGGAGKGSNYDPTCGSLVNFLTNQPRSSTRSLDRPSFPKQYFRNKVIGAYFQDDWRIRPSLTLNLGLRYEMTTIPKEIHDHVYNMPSLTTQLPCGQAILVPSGLCPQDGNPASVPGDPLALLNRVVFTHNPTLKNFEPRVGFAWDPFHDGKTAVRGGFGVFDALPLPYELVFNSTSTIPFNNPFSVVGPGVFLSPNQQGGAADQFPYQIAAITASLPPAVTPSRSLNWVEPAPSRNYVYQWNFNIQRQITPNMTVLVGYAGSRAFHNPFQADSFNTIIPTKAANGQYYWPNPYTGDLPGNSAQLLLLNPSVSNMMATDWMSRSWYNALTVKLDKRMSHGFQVEGSFTWSKSMDTTSGSATGDTFGLDYPTEPFYDLNLIRGLSDFDVPRNLVINALWAVPTPKSLGGIGEHVLGGWQVGLITELSDGAPFWPSLSSADIAGENIVTVDPPNVAAGCSPQNLTLSNYRTGGNYYLNPACVSLVPMTAANSSFCDQRLFPGTCSNIRGNLGRNTVLGPGLFNADFSLVKNTYIRRISEGFNVQFRAEFFNVLNHTNFAPPPASNLTAFDSNGVPVSTYGQLTNTQHPNRIIQFGLKLIW
jgi:Carboxypeptidase regulatory-like domain